VTHKCSATRKEIYLPQWLILHVMMHVITDIKFTAREVASKILTFLKANYLKYPVTTKTFNQVISKGF